MIVTLRRQINPPPPSPETEVHTAEPLVPGPSYLEVEIAIAKLREYKTSGSDRIQAEGDILLFVIHKVINSV
jgi:hypothetical protein